jgi:hypothetical protein
VGSGGSVSPLLPVALNGTYAYIAAPRELKIVDTRTGATVGVVTPHGAVQSGAGTAASTPAPMVVTVGESTMTLVLVPFMVTVAGRSMVELLAVDTATRHPIWTAQIDGLPAWAAPGATTVPTVRMIGVQEHTAVLEISAAGVVGEAVALDLTTHQTDWQQDGFDAGAVGLGTVVGSRAKDPKDIVGAERSIVGFGLDDGKQHWKQSDVKDAATVRVVPVGPRKAAVLGANYADGSAFGLLVDISDGTGTALPNVGETAADCAYDDTATLVCWGQDTAGHHLYGVDAASGNPLWQLGAASAQHTVPTVTAVRHGAVYGTGSAGSAEPAPIVLDARTGLVRAARPGIAPLLLDGSVGIALGSGSGSGSGSGGTVEAYRVTG